ncbi:glycosyltransferase family 2 protein [Lacibacterium aquatile]|uniref:Glycosyltransferase family 2 protein n=1 Tax=Lacibacterium aquatile TaxID=1168082 RepID=A0ABW5DXS8_9PROT
MQPEVSVIICAYKAADLAPLAIESALTQDVPVEVLVIDDASPDDSLAQLTARYDGDSRVRIIGRSRNGGPSAARNDGLDAARGTWIALLDADDAFSPGRLAYLLKAAKSLDADFVADNQRLVLDPATDEGEIAFAEAEGPILLNLDGLLDDRRFPAGRLSLGYLKPMIRRSFLDDNGLRYDTDMRMAEDFDLYARCFAAGAKAYYLSEPFYRYRRGHVSATAGGARNLHLVASAMDRLHETIGDSVSPDLRRAIQARAGRFRRAYWRTRLLSPLSRLLKGSRTAQSPHQQQP